VVHVHPTKLLVGGAGKKKKQARSGEKEHIDTSVSTGGGGLGVGGEVPSVKGGPPKGEKTVKPYTKFPQTDQLPHHWTKSSTGFEGAYFVQGEKNEKKG